MEIKRAAIRRGDDLAQRSCKLDMRGDHNGDRPSYMLTNYFKNRANASAPWPAVGRSP